MYVPNTVIQLLAYPGHYACQTLARITATWFAGHMHCLPCSTCTQTWNFLKCMKRRNTICPPPPLSGDVSIYHFEVNSWSSGSLRSCILCAYLRDTIQNPALIEYTVGYITISPIRHWWCPESIWHFAWLKILRHLKVNTGSAQLKKEAWIRDVRHLADKPTFFMSIPSSAHIHVQWECVGHIEKQGPSEQLIFCLSSCEQNIITDSNF